MPENAWTGKLVRLRAVEPNDWELFRSLDADTEISRSAYGVPFPRSVEQSQKWAADTAAAAPTGDNYRWVVETLDGTPVGTINTHGCHPEHGYFAYAVTIAREAWGKGYASEAIAIVLRYMFEERRYQKVNATVYAFNDRSRQLHEKLGFILEGRLRRVHYSGGAYNDLFLFGMTREEFAERYG